MCLEAHLECLCEDNREPLPPSRFLSEPEPMALGMKAQLGYEAVLYNLIQWPR